MYLLLKRDSACLYIMLTRRITAAFSGPSNNSKDSNNQNKKNPKDKIKTLTHVKVLLKHTVKSHHMMLKCLGDACIAHFPPMLKVSVVRIHITLI